MIIRIKYFHEQSWHSPILKPIGLRQKTHIVNGQNSLTGPMAQTAYSYRADKTVPGFDDSRPIIVFDGHCVLCSAWIGFVLKHDHQKQFRFILAQSELGEALYAHYGLKSEDYDTNLLVESGHVREKSDGTLAMFSALGWPWKLMSIFRIIPTPLRDSIYSLIARNRIGWFGAQEICYLPTPDVKARFL